MTQASGDDQSKVLRPATWSTELLLNHGWLLAFAVGLVMVSAAVALSAFGRDTALLALGGTVLVFLGVTAGRLIQFEVGREGLKLTYDQQAAQLVVEGSRTALPSEHEEPDTVADLVAGAAAVANATTESEKRQRVEDLARVVRSPALQMQAAVEWVMALERAAGRSPVAAERRGAGDVISPPRTIEVRVLPAARFSSMVSIPGWLVERAKEDPDVYLYVVEELPEAHSSFGLRVFDAAAIVRLADPVRAIYRVSTRTEVYRSAPGVERLSEARSASES